MFGFINETALFKGQWQYKQGRKTPEEYKKILEETVYPKFAEIKAQAIREKLLEAKLDCVLFMTNAAPAASIIERMSTGKYPGLFYASSFAGQDLIDMLVERIRNPESIATALGSRHRT